MLEAKELAFKEPEITKHSLDKVPLANLSLMNNGNIYRLLTGEYD